MMLDGSGQTVATPIRMLVNLIGASPAASTVSINAYLAMSPMRRWRGARSLTKFSQTFSGATDQHDPLEIPQTMPAVSDSDTATESVSVSVGILALQVNVSDSIGESDATTVQISVNVVVFDDDVATELVALAMQPLLVNVFDDDTATDVAAISTAVIVVVVDDEGATEDVQIAMQPLLVDVADTDAAAESVELAMQPLLVSVVDDDVAADVVNASTATVDGLVVAVFDNERKPAVDAEWVSVVIEQFYHRITVGDDLNETEHAALSLGDEPVESTGCGMVWEAQP